MLESLVPSVREVSADELGIGVIAKAHSRGGSSAPDAPEANSDNPVIREVVRLSSLFGGVIFTGPPGTSKSYYAAESARVLADGVDDRVRFVQFHASYQYEDFMIGFVPTTSGFKERPGPFLELVRAADADREHTYVLVIDELSRADVGRVFGEALTYVERTKRELTFALANGLSIKVPSNLIILATMNPFDRGVDEVDAAFERRFAKITMDPDKDLLADMLTASGMEAALRQRVIGWFSRINSHAQKNPAAAVGHAYFSSASDESSLDDVWSYQLRYLVQRAFRRDESTRNDLEAAWRNIFVRADVILDPEIAVETEPGV
ncbi:MULTISPECIES: McrB family protein [unclassified Microbacterium]|uniref:McrB family protein n=1 Tax=unclassified Microbacterium TaxID=2609290 RepID=UPI0030195E49